MYTCLEKVLVHTNKSKNIAVLISAKIILMGKCFSVTKWQLLKVTKCTFQYLYQTFLFVIAHHCIKLPYILTLTNDKSKNNIFVQSTSTWACFSYSPRSASQQLKALLKAFLQKIYIWIFTWEIANKTYNRKVYLAHYYKYCYNQMLKILFHKNKIFHWKSENISPFLNGWKPPAYSSYPAIDDLIWKIYICWY